MELSGQSLVARHLPKTLAESFTHTRTNSQVRLTDGIDHKTRGYGGNFQPLPYVDIPHTQLVRLGVTTRRALY